MAETVKQNLFNFILYILVIAIGVIVILFLFSKDESKIKQTSNENNLTTLNKGQFTNPPDMEINIKKKYTADLTTDAGKIKVELFAKETPVTVNNFVFLSKKGFYDGTVFHRVIKDFMIQGGDPKGDGAGGPGYTFPDEKITLDYKRGIVAMANSGLNTNGSQFFIMHKDYQLPKNYVIFGKVTEGMDTVDKIATAKVIDSGEKSTPQTPVKITKIDITSN